MKIHLYLIATFLASYALADESDTGLKLYYPVYPPKAVHQDKTEFKTDLSPEVKRALAESNSGVTDKKSFKEMTPEDIFLNAYKKAQNAKAIKGISSPMAICLLAHALSDLVELRQTFPEWQPEVVEYRIAKLHASLE